MKKNNNKVLDLTVDELKDIIRQIIKEEIPILTTINTWNCPQKDNPENYRVHYDTKTTPYEKIDRKYKCEADGVGICEASDIIK